MQQTLEYAVTFKRHFLAVNTTCRVPKAVVTVAGNSTLTRTFSLANKHAATQPAGKRSTVLFGS